MTLTFKYGFNYFHSFNHLRNFSVFAIIYMNRLCPFYEIRSNEIRSSFRALATRNQKALRILEEKKSYTYTQITKANSYDS